MDSLFEKMAAHAARRKPAFRPLLDIAVFPDQFGEQIKDLTIRVFEEEKKLLETFLGEPRRADAPKYNELSDMLLKMRIDKDPMSEAAQAQRMDLVEKFPFNNMDAREALRVSNETGLTVYYSDRLANRGRTKILAGVTGEGGKVDKSELTTVARGIVLEESARQLAEKDSPKDVRAKALAAKRVMIGEAPLTPTVVESVTTLIDGGAIGVGRTSLRALRKISRDTPELFQEKPAVSRGEKFSGR